MEVYKLGSWLLNFIFKHTVSLSYSGIGCRNIEPGAITTLYLPGEYS